MEQTEIKEQMKQTRAKMRIIEWDVKHSNTFSKSHIYNNLKKEYEELQNRLNVHDQIKNKEGSN